ncbi:hypothetical protein LCGC14_2869270 [marine sediment metagenome]|uniref:Metallothionein n=1 Tax=marine sediment metagenome TaxID=412755 RepID=A0A0F8YQ70_9ZZZZ
MTDKDIWQEGANENECLDCGCASRSCTCYEKECKNCLQVVNPADATIFNGDYYCDEDCLQLFLDE